MLRRADRSMRAGRDAKNATRWVVPNRIHDLSKPYLIDDHFGRLAAPQQAWGKEWGSSSAFGRRTLEVAIISADEVTFDDPRLGLAECKVIAARALSARQRIEALVKYLDPKLRPEA